jgi:hypothetical protein
MNLQYTTTDVIGYVKLWIVLTKDHSGNIFTSLPLSVILLLTQLVLQFAFTNEKLFFQFWFFYQKTEVEREQETFLYDFSGIVASVGGSLGLFLGFSCLQVTMLFVVVVVGHVVVVVVEKNTGSLRLFLGFSCLQVKMLFVVVVVGHVVVVVEKNTGSLGLFLGFSCLQVTMLFVVVVVAISVVVVYVFCCC